MAFNGIPPFPIHSSTGAARERRRLLCQREFSVITYAASGISAHSRTAATARITAMVEWSTNGKKTILHQDWCSAALL